MKIVADKNIPFLEGVFEPYAEVVYIDGRAINHEDIIDAIFVGGYGYMTDEIQLDEEI